MQSSSCGKVSSLNGRGATSLMDMEMYEHVHQNWLENFFSIACEPQGKTTQKAGEGTPFKSNNTQRASSERREA